MTKCSDTCDEIDRLRDLAAWRLKENARLRAALETAERERDKACEHLGFRDAAMGLAFVRDQLDRKEGAD